MKFTTFATTSFLALATGVSATTGPARPATFYDPDGNFGACGTHIQNGDFAVPLSSANYAGGAHCGQRLNVQYNGKTIGVVVEDFCPGCAANGIDLTRGAFQSLADTNLGVIQVEWNVA
ncbi:RlpA-like double-psi beta-barrel-protein domain-containing protein-containing protein [Mycena vulgaris]|nr:RlpA-like double-psi beta-barrel-protein domain-containing protein-containing protein [Mycena vulgaris]